MRRLAFAVGITCLLASGAGAFLVANSLVGTKYVFERVPSNRRPIHFTVDTETIPNVTNPVGIAQELMDQWNAVPGVQAPFGTATAGGPYNGANVGSTFGVFTNTKFEIAWDDTGEIFTFFGISGGVLGITLKSVDTDSGNILDMLVVVSTRPGALVAPGSGATSEQLFRATLLHEIGHAAGLAHSPVGMSNASTFGLALTAPQQMATMFPFRFSTLPQEGATLEADDRSGIVNIYPMDTSALGSISGTVQAASAAGVNEIAVRAVGPFGVGEGHVGVLTNADGKGLGSYTISGLVPGAYRLVIEAVNGRSSVSGASLSSSAQSLGSDPFVFAGDEFWQKGDTYDPSNDDKTTFTLVQVRAGRDTGSVDVLLNARPLVAGPAVAAALAGGDEQLPDATGGFHFVDYYVFAGAAGQPVTIDATGTGVVPQLTLLRPSDLDIADQDAPTLGTASLSLSLPETGVYTLAVSARGTTGVAAGSGPYTLTLAGASGSLPPVPPSLPATATFGASNPGAQQFGNPVCDKAVLQVRLTAPTLEELWVDAITLRAAGTGDDPADVAEVALVDDRNGDGIRQSNEPILATGTYSADNGTLTLSNLDLEIDPGASMNLLVLYDVAVTSVSSTAQQAGVPWWLALALFPLVWKWGGRGGRCRALVLALPLLLATCGGGGGSDCNGAFDAAGAVVTFQVSIAPGGIVAFGSASDPGTPLGLPAGALASATLSVSN